MAKDQFRSDLYFRLSVHQIELLPLRQRKEDLPLLVERFVEAAASAMNKERPQIPVELYDLLGIYSFDGNIRELRAMVYDAVAAHRGGQTLSLQRFRNSVEKIQHIRSDEHNIANRTLSESLILIPGQFPTLAQSETELVKEAMRRANGNQGVAAILLGISRPALNRRLARDREIS
jgi:transcriptional regulator with PAS, ATPase and Fis domain